jgi:hypothetical protein
MRQDYPPLPCNHLQHKGLRGIELLGVAMMRPYRKASDGQ